MTSLMLLEIACIDGFETWLLDREAGQSSARGDDRGGRFGPNIALG
jgi:hypothetical protein